jgi:hypothetical protein
VVLIRDATPGDWTLIWPFLREIVAAGGTLTYDRALTESQPRDLWSSIRRAGRWWQ